MKPKKPPTTSSHTRPCRTITQTQMQQIMDSVTRTFVAKDQIKGLTDVISGFLDRVVPSQLKTLVRNQIGDVV